MIRFFIEAIDFKVPQPIRTKRWLQQVAREEGARLNALNYIFCSDEYLHQMNVQFLQHDTLTDVITFDNSEDLAALDGEVYISVDRVKANAAELILPFEDELRRVMVHGLLHLIGYSDKNAAQKKEMTLKENFYLACFGRRFT